MDTQVLVLCVGCVCAYVCACVSKSLCINGLSSLHWVVNSVVSIQPSLLVVTGSCLPCSDCCVHSVSLFCQLMYLSRSLHAPPPRPAPVQLHVLSYSLHALLCDLSKHLASGDLDSCLQAITDIVTEDLFGQLAEEREVPEAASKLPEAKSSKGLATLEIVSSKLSPQLLPSLIAPLKKVGAVHHNFSWARVPLHTAQCLARHFASCSTLCVALLRSLCTFLCTVSHVSVYCSPSLLPSMCPGC